MIKSAQLNLFSPEALEIEVNGVRGVNSIDLYDMKIPFDSTPGQFIELKDYVKKGEYTLHSSGSYHYFYYTHVTEVRPGLLPNYFNQPVFPWIQSVHNKSGKIRVPGVPQTKVPYPYVSLNHKKLLMHILCASAFLERPEDPNYCLVSHRNDMKWDYSLRNLFWNTHKNNSVGFKKERRMNPVEIFDKWWSEFERGVEYNVEDWHKDDDGF